MDKPKVVLTGGSSPNSQIADSASVPALLDYIRPTSLRDFDECPDKWRVKYLDGFKGDRDGKNKASDIGTAVHSIIEMHLKAMSGHEFDQVLFKREYAKIPVSETDALMAYLERLNEFAGMEVLGVEIEFVSSMIHGMPPIKGHIDAVFRDMDMNIIILDHKTNRSSNDETYWSSQLQQQIYALAARNVWQCRSVDFRIGYVNLGYDVQWTITPQDDARTVRRITEIWEKMQQYSYEYQNERQHNLGAHWPRNVTEGCRWCPIQSRCIEYQESLNNFAKSFEKKISTTITQQLEFTKIVEKLVAAKKDELEEIIRARVVSSDTGSFTDGDTTWQMANKTQRSVKASYLMGLFGAMLKEEVLSVETYKEYLDIIFSAKITGIDKMLKAHPELKELVTEIIEIVPVGAGSLKTVKHDKMIGNTMRLGLPKEQDFDV